MLQKIMGSLFLMGLSSLAFASGPYVGIQTGITDLHYSGSQYTLPTNSVDSTRFAGRLYGGYAFSEFLAAEVGYDYLGHPTFQHRQTRAKQDFLQQGIDVVAKATLPLDYGFGMYLKAGGMWVHRDNMHAENGLFVAKDTSGKISLLGGAGVSYIISQPVSLDLSWTKSLRNGSLPKIDLYMVGLVYKF